MKNLYKFLLLALIANLTVSAQCGSLTLITLTNQSQVDAFPQRFPGCTEFTGPLLINGSNITNLNGLSAFTKFGELAVFNCPLLANLHGLENLVSVGALNFTNNAVLTDITALSHLTEITRGLNIEYGVLTDLHGLEGVTAIGGQLNIGGNGLVSLRGLDNVTSIGSYFTMSNSTTLSDLSALSNLTSIALYVNFSNMPALTTLHGLDNVVFTTDRPINISNCPNLTMCSVLGVCRFLDSGGTGTIINNGVGCSTIQQIIDRCTSMATEGFEKNKTTIYPNPAADYVSFHQDGEVTNAVISVVDLSGKEIFHADFYQDMELDVRAFHSGMYIIRITSKSGTSQYKLLKM